MTHDAMPDGDRTAVEPTRGGAIRLTTPEGGSIEITPIRALEWTSDRQFIDLLRGVAMNVGIPYRVVELEEPR